MVKVSDNEVADQDFVRVAVRLPPIGDELAHDPVIFPAAGIGAVFTEVVHVPGNAAVGLS
jgi:hypothetical protein